jgi:heme/copper-type cytochrome/quinol oxidase subunit 2
MWLAPLLAVILALLIAGAIVALTPQSENKYDLSTPNTLGTPSPQAAASVADLYFLPMTAMFFISMVLVGIAVWFLFFREKRLRD